MSETILKELGEKFGLMLDWSSENAIPYLQELAQRVVKFETGTSIFWLIFALVLLIFSVILIKVAIKHADDWLEEAVFWSCFIGFCIIILCVIIICCQIDDLITCKYLPEKILLEYVKDAGK